MICKDAEKYLDLFNSEDCERIIFMAYRLTDIQRSTDNIEFAANRASKVVFALKNFARIGHSDEKEIASITEGIETVLTLYSNQLKQGIEVSKTLKICLVSCATLKNFIRFGQIFFIMPFTR